MEENISLFQKLMDNFEIFVPLIIAAISFGVNVWNNIRELNYKKEVLKESKISDKRKELAKKLNEFYGPFLQNLKKSTTLYRALTYNRNDDFRLLDCLLDKKKYKEQKFDANDQTLIMEILEIGKQQQKIIKQKGGLIDDPILALDYSDINFDKKFNEHRSDLRKIGLVPQANAHYRILELASEGKLTGDAIRFIDYRFPRDLPDEIARRFIELQEELEKLRSITTNKDDEVKQ